MYVNTTNMESLESFQKVPPGGCKRNGGKFKRKLSEVNTRAVSREQDELISNFKMAVGVVISIRGQVMEYTCILTGIEPGINLR